MADNDEDRPKTQAESDYEEDYLPAPKYYGDDSAGPTDRTDPKYDDSAPAGPATPPEADASYDRRRYSEEELSKLSGGVHGNDEWFASGAGVANEPFERSWTGLRRPSGSTTQRPSTGILRVSAAQDRRSITRRDLGHDPFVERVGADERRSMQQDRRSGSATERYAQSRKPAPPRSR